MRKLLCASAIALIATNVTARAWASCNLIPSARLAFRSTAGAANKPFAAPGDFVEVSVPESRCKLTPANLNPTANSNVVTIVYTPPLGGTRRAIVISAHACVSPEVSPQVAACGALLEPENVDCIGGATLAIVNRDGIDRLSFRFPDASQTLLARDLSGPATIAVTDINEGACGFAPTNCASQSDGVTLCVDDLYANDGTCQPNLHPTFPHFTALPPPNDYRSDCIGSAIECAASANDVKLAVDTAGNFLLPVNWSGILLRQNNQPIPRIVRATLKSPVSFFIAPPLVAYGSYTPEGARLPPIFEPRNDPNGSPAADTISVYGTADAAYTILRVARRHRSCIGANVGAPCTSDSDCGGGTCPFRCVGGASAGQECDADSDCGSGTCGTLIFADPRTQTKAGEGIALVRAEPQICQVDPHDECNNDGGCSGLGDPCVSYAFEANEPVLLEGTACSDNVCTFPANERAALKELNQDADQTDVVLTLQDRQTGRTMPIGPGGEIGRAVSLVRKGASRFAAVASEGDVVAFLEPEATEGTTTNADVTSSANDEDGDGDAFDTMLRVFERNPGNPPLVPPTAVELTAGISPPIAADADHKINGKSLAVSGGRVFFRTPEWANAPETTVLVTQSDTGVGADKPSRNFDPGRVISDDGRFIVFGSSASNLVTGLVVTVGEHIYVRDRDADGNGILDEPDNGVGLPETTTELVSKTALSAPADGSSSAPSISGDGRYVAFTTTAANLLPGLAGTCPNSFAPGAPCPQMVVKDRQTGAVELLSAAFGGGYADGENFYAHITRDGRFISFMSTASNMLAPGEDANDTCDNIPDGIPDQNCYDGYVYDRCESYGNPVVTFPPCTAGIERVTLDDVGQEIAGRSSQVTISDDGRYAAFNSAVSFWPGDGGLETMFVRDRELDETLLISQLSGIPDFGQVGWMSPDGRLVSFDSTQSYAPPGAGSYSAYAYDLATATFEQWSQNSEGVLSNNQSGAGPFSADGRFGVFYSTGYNLDADSTAVCNGGPNPDCTATFVRDRIAGLTKRITESDTGGEISANSRLSSISADGHNVTFSSDAQDVLAGDTKLCDTDGDSFADDPCPDIFVRTLDWSQTATFDRSGDGIFDDTILEVLDGTTRTPLCPASDAAAANGKVAFLRPEKGGATTLVKLPDCPVGSVSGRDTDLNSDGDRVDQVVQLWTGSGSVQNLARAASAVALSSTLVAAIDDDGTLATYPVSGGSWTDTGESATSIQFCGDVVAFLSDTGEVKFRATDGTIVSTGEVAHEIVCNSALAAFRTPESVDMNNDNDTADDVLQTWTLTPECLPGMPVDCLGTSAQAVIPCYLDACAPSTPYRVQGDTVKFLTLECQQGDGPETNGCSDPGGARDLNQDGDAADVVIQVYDTIADTVTPYGTVADGSDPLAEGAPGGGSTYASTGRCIEFFNACDSNADCVLPQFCTATEMLSGYCEREHGVCITNADCPPNIACAPQGIMPASRDSDGDGIPDHLDNCPDNANSGQEDIDGDGAGDICDIADCGDNSADYDEECDGTDDSACPGNCTDCACTVACPNVISDPKAKLSLKTAKGQAVGKLTLTLASAYVEQPVTLRLDDSDPDPIASQALGSLLPVGSSGTKWQLKTKNPGVQKVLLKTGKNPGEYKLNVKARSWFTAAAVDENIGTTELTLRVGAECFRLGATSID